jgi:hypothetical protein
VKSPGIIVYGWTPDIDENESDQNTEEYAATNPFIEF